MVLSLFTAILECDVIWSEAGTRAVPTTLEPKWLRVVEKLDPERAVYPVGGPKLDLKNLAIMCIIYTSGFLR